MFCLLFRGYSIFYNNYVVYDVPIFEKEFYVLEFQLHVDPEFERNYHLGIIVPT